MCKCSDLSTSWSTLVIVCLFIVAVLMGKGASHCGLVCSFLMTKAIERLFMSLLAIRVSSLEKCLFKIFAHFKNVLFVFLLLSCKSSLYTLDTSKFLIRCMLCKYILFFHSLGCLFTFLLVSYEAYGFLMLMKSILSILSLLCRWCRTSEITA